MDCLLAYGKKKEERLDMNVFYKEDTNALVLDRVKLDSCDILMDVVPFLRMGMMKGVRDLQLEGNHLDVGGVQLLLHGLMDYEVKLQRLNLGGNYVGSAEGVNTLGEYLRSSVLLESLDLKECGLKSKGVRGLCEYLPGHFGLQYLDVSQNDVQDAAVLDLVVTLALGCRNMMVLTMRGNPVVRADQLHTCLYLYKIEFDVKGLVGVNP